MFTPSTWRRVVAWLIDQLIGALCFLPVIVQILSSFLHHGEVSVSWTWIFVCTAVLILYRWLFLYFLGGTIGKLILGLRVVSFPDQRPLSLMQALLRVLTDSLALFFSQGLHSLALLRFDRRHVSDWVAETWVRQRFESQTVARPRPVLAVLLCLYFSVSGFYSLYSMVQKSDLDSQGITLTGLAAGFGDSSDSLQSGE